MLSNDAAIRIVIVAAAFMAVGFIISIIAALAKKDSVAYAGLFILAIGTVVLVAIIIFMQHQQKVSERETEPTAVIETETKEAVIDGWSGDVSDGAQMVLRQIAEDMAKQIAQNPGTVKMGWFTDGYAKNGHLYAVQQEFSCSNLMGVSETHTIRVVCESNEDESKIYPFEVWLDGELVTSQERKYPD